MLAFLLGVLSLALVIALARGIRYRRWRSSRGGWRARRWSWGLQGVMYRLGARPEQQSEIRDTLQEMFSELNEQRDVLAALREDLAGAVSADVWEGPALEGLLRGVDRAAGELRDAARRGFARLHAVLDPAQRQRLAELLREGFGGHHHRYDPHPVKL